MAVAPLGLAPPSFAYFCLEGPGEMAGPRGEQSQTHLIGVFGAVGGNLDPKRSQLVLGWCFGAMHLPDPSLIGWSLF